MLVMFALLIPALLALTGFVIGIGNWYTHGKHLQTKADAGAFAGGSTWGFPCDSAIDARIEAAARLYAGSNNPQVGGVPDTSITTILNGDGWYDNDSNPFQGNFNSPTGPVCSTMTLDVKVTEDNSFPLASLIPLFPDLKRKARIEVREADAITEDLLPIAVRAPEPVSAAAVFYDEQSAQRTILGVKYFVRSDSIGALPTPLQGWTTYNNEDLSTWSSFTPASSTGVAIAVSFRGACYDASIPGFPNPNLNTKIRTGAAPCFQDSYVGQPLTNLCNQGTSTQIVNCYYTDTNTSWPNENVLSGLQFIRGFPNLNPGTGPPAIESSHLISSSCLVQGVSSPAYFNAHPNTACQAQLSTDVDIGTLGGDYSAPFNGQPDAPLRAQDVEVRYRLVRGDGSSSCNYGANCDLLSSSNGSVKTYLTQGTGGSPHLPLTANSRQNAVAIQIRLRNAVNSPNANCRNSNFSNNCRWYYTGNGMFGTSVAPTDVQILAAPIQRAFRGNSLTSSSIQWLRVTADPDCAGAAAPVTDLAAASQRTDNGAKCFFMEMGRKGGVPTDQDTQPILFNDGVGSSQMGSLDCDPNIPQGQVLIDGVIQGCGPEYGVNPFDWSPLCPQQNQIFAQPNPGPPWNDGRWPPLRCVKTRPTGSMNQLERGLDNRLFGSNNAPCPQDSATGPVRGRNYWDNDNNLYDGATYTNDVPPSPNNISNDWDDPRLVTIFLVPTEAFAGSGQNTYPITGFIDVYITGYGRIQGNGTLNVDDPCPGSAPPTDLDLSGGSASGYAVWGHIINYVHRGGGATPSDRPCNPGQSLMPCVAALVE